MIWFIIIVFVFLAFPIVPYMLTHLHLIIPYAITDLYKYIKYRRWNECKYYGKILTYNGLFGTGKTLSSTRFIRNIYDRYNGKLVYDFERKEWVTQNIHIVCNYHLTDVPYTPLTSESQLINIEQPEHDVTIFVLDEIGAIFNNRDYKNFTPDVLTSLLQCRKRKALFIGTSQRFQMQDKNFRTTMETANQCKKTWRIVKVSTYDAYQLENCSNPLMLKPLHSYYWFAKDSDYEAYDTTEMVGKLIKDAEADKLMSSAEISAKESGAGGDVALATSVKRRYRKRS